MWVLVITLILLNVIHSFILSHQYRRWIRKGMEHFEDKRKQLEEIVESADMMVHELNNISDYVTTHIEQANNNIMQSIKDLDEKMNTAREMVKGLDTKIEELHQAMDQRVNLHEQFEKEFDTNRFDEESIGDLGKKPFQEKVSPQGKASHQERDFLIGKSSLRENSSPTEKAFPMEKSSLHEPENAYTKSSMVARMAKEGMSVRKIAKELNIGQGEVELLLKQSGGNK